MDLDDVIDKAMDAAEKEVTGDDEETTPEPKRGAHTREEEPEQEDTDEEEEVAPAKGKAAAPAADDDDDDDQDEDENPLNTSVSKEDLDEINKHPKLKRLLKNMNRAFTQNSMRRSAELGSMKQVIEALNDPAQAKRAAGIIARSVGLNLADEVAEVKPSKAEATMDARLAELEEVLTPEAAKLLLPRIRGIAQDAIKEALNSELEPIKAITGELTSQAQEAMSVAEVNAFRARHKDEITPAVEKEMMRLFKVLKPAEGMEPKDYLDLILAAASTRTTKKDATREVTRRMKDAADRREPKAGMPASRVTQQKSDAKPRTLDEAFDQEWDDIIASRRE